MSPRTEPNRVSRRHVLAGLGALAAIGSLPSRGAVPERSDRPLLFTNIRLFDGTTPRLRDGLEVLIHAGRITAVEAGMGAIEHAQVIDGGGRVLMPGLIDAHYHAMFAALPADRLQSEGLDYLALVAAQETEAALMRGYTSVRDMAGASFGLKRAIDENRMAGPRIYPSGLALSQTGGHGERRSPAAVPSEADVPHLTAEQCCSVIADGVDEVRRATREQFYKGASQIKIISCHHR